MDSWAHGALLLWCIYLSVSPASTAKPKKDATCSPFPYVELEHGSISPGEGDSFILQCKPDYFLTSPRQVRCWQGKWTSTKEPSCLKRGGTCDDPEPVPNSKILGEERHPGAVIQYMCDEGFVLLGDGTRTCLNSGYWSGITPSCMDEKEPLQTLAERLNSKFVTEMANYTEDSVLVQSRKLDSASIRHGLELIVLFDRSSSVDPEDFKIGKNFIKFLLKEFGVRNGNNPSGTRAAVLAFGTKVDMVFNVDDARITGPRAANEALDAVEPGGGGTAMELALTDGYLQVSPLLRKKAKRALFLITDGEPNIGSPGITPKDVANTLKKDGGFEIFTVGIGRGINRKLLGEVASEPLSSHVFVLDKYSDLIDIMKVIKDRPTEAPPITEERCGYLQKPENHLKKWPWIAALYITTTDDEGKHRLSFCSGTLICSQWIITAASCFYSIHKKNGSEVVRTHTNRVFVSLGERNLVQDEKNQMNFYAVDVRIHPNFDPLDDLTNNLALVKLNIKAPMGRFRPACLPPKGKTVPMHRDFSINASIAGWGIPPTNADPQSISAGTVQFHFSTVSAPLAEEHECRRFSNGEGNIFCAGFRTCVGDLGSPRVAVDPATKLHHLLGVLSRRSHCARYYNLYAEMTQYTEWIDGETGKCHREH